MKSYNFGKKFSEVDVLRKGYTVRLYDGNIFLNMRDGTFVDMRSKKKIVDLRTVYPKIRTVKNFSGKVIAKSNKKCLREVI